MNLLSPDSGRRRPPFTAAQMEELHVQAHVYKHMLMGVPVPPELLLAVRRSFDAMAAARLYLHPFNHQHQPFLSFSSYLGKKFDPEPGRCRRTDGKKWRCAKEAYPDSKYCERHMRRGKNRSRKPVETQSQLQPQSNAAMAVGTRSLALSGGNDNSCLHKMNLQFEANGQLAAAAASEICSSGLQLHTGCYGTNDTEFRYPYGIKAKVDEKYSEVSKSATGLGIFSTQNNPWVLAHSSISSFPALEIPTGFALENNLDQHSEINDLDRVSTNLLQKQDQFQTSLFGQEFLSTNPTRQSQPLRPFFDEWPNSRSSWSDQEESKSTSASFSTTQLSISLPMASPDFQSLGC